MKSEPLSWNIEQDDDLATVVFSGVLDERCDLDPLHNLTGRVIFDLAAVSRINSVGVTQWVKFIEGLEDVTELTFIHCSVPMVTQLNMIRSFGGNCAVESFYAPYVCTATGEEQDVLLTTRDLVDPLNPPIYPSDAGGELVLGDLPLRYFSFLKHLASREPDSGAAGRSGESGPAEGPADEPTEGPADQPADQRADKSGPVG